MTTELELGSRVVASRDQVSSTLADEAVILNVREGMYYGLSPVGARIWELLRAPTSLRDVVATIVAEYEVSPERAASDVLALASELRTKGLLSVVDPAAP